MTRLVLAAFLLATPLLSQPKKQTCQAKTSSVDAQGNVTTVCWKHLPAPTIGPNLEGNILLGDQAFPLPVYLAVICHPKDMVRLEIGGLATEANCPSVGSRMVIVSIIPNKSK